MVMSILRHVIIPLYQVFSIFNYTADAVFVVMSCIICCRKVSTTCSESTNGVVSMLYKSLWVISNSCHIHILGTFIRKSANWEVRVGIMPMANDNVR